MKVMVTGAAGFIGSNLVETLLQNGHDVSYSDNFDETLYAAVIKERNIENHISHIQVFPNGNLKNREFDALVHLAALPGLVDRPDSSRQYTEKNILGTLDALEIARSTGVKKFIFISTSSVYGITGIGNEELPINPISYYGLSKAHAEQLVIKFCIDEGIDYTILRLFSVYGPKQRPDMAIHKILVSLVLDKEFKVYSSLDAIRSNTYVSDVCDAILSVLNTKVSNQTYNICGEQKMSLGDWIRLAEALAGKKLNMSLVPPRRGDQQITAGDCTKAKRELNFKNSVNLEEGLYSQLVEIKKNLDVYL